MAARWRGRAWSAPVVAGGGRPSSPRRRSRAATRAACAARPSGRAARSSPAASGTSSRVWGWSGSTPLSAAIGSPMATSGLPGRNPYSQHPLLVLGLLHELLEQLGALAPRSSSTHSASRMKNGLSEKSVPSSGIDGHERDAGRAGLLAGLEHAVGVAAVVVDDRLLLDGDGRGVGQRRCPAGRPGTRLLRKVRVVSP